VIVNSFATSTAIDVMQSRNNLDQMRGHFLARSSLNLTELILRLQRVVDEKGEQWGIPPGTQLTMFADSLMMAFGGDHTMVEDAIGIRADQVKGLGAGIGTFGVEITPVDGKINVNCAHENPGRFAELTATLIQSLIYPTAFDPVFEEEDSEGWRRDRKTQVTAIIDFIDPDTVKSEIRDNKLERTSAPEDYGYENLRDTYKAKNNRVDSVSELKLVRGVDDRFWTLFGKAFRAYGTCKINLRGLDDAKVVAAVIALAAEDENDQVLRNPAALWAISNLVLLGKDYGFYYTTPQEFIDFVAKPREMFAGLGGGGAGTGGTGATPPPPSNAPLPGGIELPPGVEGIVLNSGKLGDITESKPLINYEVRAWGEVQRAPLVSSRRTLRAFWNQEHTNQQPRNASAKNGAWFFLREE
jgi:general secretion pathway protein K